MTSSEEQISLMQMLATTEEAVGRLYETYANSFTEHEEFWFGLAMEEADHSNSILDLIRKVREGSASFFEDRRLAEAVRSFQNLLKEQRIRTAQEKMSFTDALLVALDIEKSLIEHGFYWLLEGASKETRSVLEYLDSAAENHVKVLQREIEHQKKQT
jgi:hypothetical protein